MATSQKSVDSLTAKQALAELKKLVEAGVEFKKKFDEKTSVEDLRKLVVKGRAALEASEEEDEDEDKTEAEDDESEEGEEEDTEDEADESEEEDSVEADEDPEEVEDEEEDDADIDGEVSRGEAVHVFDKGDNYVRSYTKQEHGKKYLDLAKQFISKSGREGFTVKKTK